MIHPGAADATVSAFPAASSGATASHRAAGLELVDLDHGDLPDPVARAISILLDHVEKLEHKLDDLAARQGTTDDRAPPRMTRISSA